MCLREKGEVLSAKKVSIVCWQSMLEGKVMLLVMYVYSSKL